MKGEEELAQWRRGVRELVNGNKPIYKGVATADTPDDMSIGRTMGIRVRIE